MKHLPQITPVDIRSLVGGWSLKDEASNIRDNESPSLLNVVFDGGIISPRTGSSLLFEKPTGESNAPLQSISPTTADGNGYFLGIYGNNFYIRDETNNRWIKINQTYSPTETTLRYGWVNWQNGRADDRTYLCNGVDPFLRYDPAVSQLNGSHADSVTTVTLDDGTYFPSPTSYAISGVNTGTEEITIASHPFVTGDLVFYDTTSGAITGLSDGGIYFVIKVSSTVIKLATTYANALAGTAIDLSGSGSGAQGIYKGETILVITDGTNTVTAPYTGKTGNNFTLSKALGTAFADNSSVTVMLTPRPSMETGRVVEKHQRRIFSANYRGGENTVQYSVQDSPEDFTTGATVSSGSSAVIADGYGEITAILDFGEFVIIGKNSSYHIFKIRIADDLGSKLDEIRPLVSGQSVGPVDRDSVVKILNSLLLRTSTEGFISLSPSSSGDSSSVGMNIASEQIQTYVTDLASFTKCRSITYGQRALFAHAIVGGTQNTRILVYDMVRKTWYLLGNWSVEDFAIRNDELLFLEAGTGDVYQAFTNQYDDEGQPYACEFYTKRFDFNILSRPKTEHGIYLQGYLTPSTDLFVDVLYNESGLLKKQTFRINKDTDNLYYSEPLSASLGLPVMGLPILGQTLLSEIGNVSFFRCYLGASGRHGYYNIQLRFYSNKTSFWGITGISFSPEAQEVIPSEIIINPTITS